MGDDMYVCHDGQTEFIELSSMSDNTISSLSVVKWMKNGEIAEWVDSMNNKK
jgi:hypothetical protein